MKTEKKIELEKKISVVVSRLKLLTAKDCKLLNLNWDTVRKAKMGIPVRFREKTLAKYTDQLSDPQHDSGQ